MENQVKHLLILTSILLLSSFLTSCTQPNEIKYVGMFKNGQWDGQGTFTSPDGGKFVGEWKDDKPNGQGAFTYSDGEKYVGEWKNGKLNGQGTYTLIDGSKFIGEWKDGVLWNGIQYDKNGNIVGNNVSGK